MGERGGKTPRRAALAFAFKKKGEGKALTTNSEHGGGEKLKKRGMKRPNGFFAWPKKKFEKEKAHINNKERGKRRSIRHAANR